MSSSYAPEVLEGKLGINGLYGKDRISGLWFSHTISGHEEMLGCVLTMKYKRNKTAARILVIQLFVPASYPIHTVRMEISSKCWAQTSSKTCYRQFPSNAQHTNVYLDENLTQTQNRWSGNWILFCHRHRRYAFLRWVLRHDVGAQ